jgi:hypothetical protein
MNVQIKDLQPEELRKFALTSDVKGTVKARRGRIFV